MENKEGVQTNTERRVNIVRQFVQPPGDAKSDHWIFCQLAKRHEQGRKMQFSEDSSVMFDEMKQLSKGEGRILDISGMSHDLIAGNCGLQSLRRPHRA